MSNTLNILLWVVVPYVTFAVFVVGTFWRFRYDKFGWTTRSSQLYERRLLRLGSPLFHLGLLMVIVGHLVGLVIPKSWTEAVGVSETAYHFVATWMGSLGAVAVVVGLLILIYRRRTTGPVFLATTRMDKTMYVFLAASILVGAWATIQTQIIASGHGYDYRETISPWFRSLWYFQPEPALMAGVPLAFKLHILAANALFMLWPFTRLVHAFSAPVPYLFRPFIVYRSRDAAISSRAERPGGTRRAGPRSERRSAVPSAHDWDGSAAVRVMAQMSMVMNLDKCIGCHSCSVACKQAYTAHEGARYMWFNDVETRPGRGYPYAFEDQDRWQGGWEVRSGSEGGSSRAAAASHGLRLRGGGRTAQLARLFAQPRMPLVTDYDAPWSSVLQSRVDGPTVESAGTGANGPKPERPEPEPAESVAADPVLTHMSEHVTEEFEQAFRFYLPRICEHCLNPACVAACPSGAMYKRVEDGIVLIDDAQCRGFRACVPACPYKKVYLNPVTGKATKCTLCVGRIEQGEPTLCSDTCVGHLRYIGLVLYDADRVAEAASVADEKDLLDAQRSVFLDPEAPDVVAAAAAQGIPEEWVLAAQMSPIWALISRFEVALPLHPEYRTLPMVWYVPPVSPVADVVAASGADGEDFATLSAAIDRLEAPVAYLAELFTAGDRAVAARVLRRLVAVRTAFAGPRPAAKPAARPTSGGAAAPAASSAESTTATTGAPAAPGAPTEATASGAAAPAAPPEPEKPAPRVRGARARGGARSKVDPEIAAAVGMSGPDLTALQKLLTKADYADRHIIPPAYRESAAALEELGCELDGEEGPAWAVPAPPAVRHRPPRSLRAPRPAGSTFSGGQGRTVRTPCSRRGRELGGACRASAVPRQWSAPSSCATRCPSSGRRTSIPSRTPPVDPGRLTTTARVPGPSGAEPSVPAAPVPATSVLLASLAPQRAIPARPRDSTAVGTFFAP
ncbi:hypothetical protein GCM10025865_16890 [Paraoerskovia sediminicola]|uniref:4Fe-4S ferredoxin-type domain-containing protein n=1 Tax=Paraoerskovia sediminicola TaxID=1138587 RepID=A0ABM8G2U9_9CELL|nr:respiratory nitrate reductase subunit gamma [Paraoerskovia sediminicola]BDZ42390.1 hypothetical protein GCM10025865_16890 [Paraoerskovia sediminicola]